MIHYIVNIFINTDYSLLADVFLLIVSFFINFIKRKSSHVKPSAILTTHYFFAGFWILGQNNMEVLHNNMYPEDVIIDEGFKTHTNKHSVNSLCCVRRGVWVWGIICPQAL
ncbi:MAG: hypothetical protein K0R55_1177 [Sporomusa sp.]|nr:hypothetical protein [Sporomusa sp.]